MLSLDNTLYVRIQELPGGPSPLPLRHGFNNHTAYRALGMFNPSETSDAYFILSNDRNETWFICNRHLRTVALGPQMLDFRCPLQTFTGLNPALSEGAAGTPSTAVFAAEAGGHQRAPVEPDQGPHPMPPGGPPPQHQRTVAVRARHPTVRST